MTLQRQAFSLALTITVSALSAGVLAWLCNRLVFERLLRLESAIALTGSLALAMFCRRSASRFPLRLPPGSWVCA